MEGNHQRSQDTNQPQAFSPFSPLVSGKKCASKRCYFGYKFKKDVRIITVGPLIQVITSLP